MKREAAYRDNSQVWTHINQSSSQATLPNTRIAAHSHGMPETRVGSHQMHAQPRQLLGPTNQWGVGSGVVLGRSNLAGEPQQLQRLSLTLHRHHLRIIADKGVADQIRRCGSAAHLAPCGIHHHPRRNIHRIAHHGVLFALGGAHIPGEDIAGVQADA